MDFRVRSAKVLERLMGSWYESSSETEEVVDAEGSSGDSRTMGVED